MDDVNKDKKRSYQMGEDEKTRLNLIKRAVSKDSAAGKLRDRKSKIDEELRKAGAL